MRAREFIFEAAYDSMVVAMKQKFPDQAAYIDQWVRWAKTALQKADRVTWFLKILRADLAQTLGPKELGTYQFTDLQQLANQIHHFYGFDYAPIQNYVYKDQPVGQVVADLTAFENTWRTEQEKNRGVTPQEGDYKLFEFPDGTSWWWVDRAYCPDEGRSGEHCGNVVGRTKKNQRILSLRNQQMRVICTFILEPDGTLGEMKAKNNQKPSEKYHPQILKLLMWDRIKGIAPTTGQYNASANFNVFDLNEKQLAYVDQTKPQLITSQITSMPVSALRMPDSMKEKYQAVVTKANAQIGKLLFNATDTNWSAAVDQDPKLIIYAPTTIDNWRNRVIDIISRTEFLLYQAPSYIAKNYDLLKDIVEISPKRIGEVNPNLKGYDRLCQLAVDLDGSVLKYVPDNLKTPALCMSAVTQDGAALIYVPDNLKTPKLCMAAVKQDGDTLRYVPDNLKTPALCMAAVKQDGNALRYVPDTLKTPEMCQWAVESNGYALYSVPDEFKTQEMCLAAVQGNVELSNLLEQIPEQFRTPELYWAAVKNPKSGQHVLRYVPEELRTPEMYRIAVENNGGALYLVPDKLKTPELCLIAVKTDQFALREVPEKFKTPKLCLAAVKNSGGAIEWVPEHLRSDKLLLLAFKTDLKAFKYMPDHLKTEEMCLGVINRIPKYLEFVPVQLRTAEICITAVNQANIWDVAKVFTEVPEHIQPLVYKQLSPENKRRIRNWFKSADSAMPSYIKVKT